MWILGEKETICAEGSFRIRRNFVAYIADGGENDRLDLGIGFGGNGFDIVLANPFCHRIGSSSVSIFLPSIVWPIGSTEKMQGRTR